MKKLNWRKCHAELVSASLQRDSETGKLDHPPNGSKDISDSLAGAVWDLSLLPYSPGLSNFSLSVTGDQDTLPDCFRNMGGSGLRPLDKYSFDRI